MKIESRIKEICTELFFIFFIGEGKSLKRDNCCVFFCIYIETEDGHVVPPLACSCLGFGAFTPTER